MLKEKLNIIKSSFRDKSGFLFTKENILYRQINLSYQEHYEYLMDSGVYDLLVDKKLLVPHVEVSDINGINNNEFKIIRPEYIPFISYPYEWCFSQLKDAALLTLKIQEIILKKGMILKDASAYNVQFKDGKPIFIDTLSFEKYSGQKPWDAYYQFCKHFLAPLALMSYKDVRLANLLKTYIDGIPLDLTSKILPTKTYFKFSILSHIHLHAKSEKYFENSKKDYNNKKIKITALLGLVDNLKTVITNLNLIKSNSTWADYWAKSNYSDAALNHKKQIVDSFLSVTKSHTAWDIGANDGTFSKIASSKGIQTFLIDSDPYIVEKNYLTCKRINEKKTYPLLMDITNPSPGIGWENTERSTLYARAKPDIIMALAIIHHLVIANNLSFEMIAKYFSGLCKVLIIEFIPKNDSQITKLLTVRKDIFVFYNQDHFERIFLAYFSIKQKVKINDSERTIYLMQSLEK